MTRAPCKCTTTRAYKSRQHATARTQEHRGFQQLDQLVDLHQHPNCHVELGAATQPTHAVTSQALRARRHRHRTTYNVLTTAAPRSYACASKHRLNVATGLWHQQLYSVCEPRHRTRRVSVQTALHTHAETPVEPTVNTAWDSEVPLLPSAAQLRSRSRKSLCTLKQHNPGYWPQTGRRRQAGASLPAPPQ